jgi:hypothetical protein
MAAYSSPVWSPASGEQSVLLQRTRKAYDAGAQARTLEGAVELREIMTNKAQQYAVDARSERVHPGFDQSSLRVEPWGR